MAGQSGVAVIAVHDNSSSVEEIQEHAAKKGMEMPTVVDHPDGRVLQPWNDLGLVDGYPRYVLLDPDGRLVAVFVILCSRNLLSNTRFQLFAVRDL